MDKLIWPYTSSGQYSVQSGYSFLAKENIINPATANPNPNGGVWKLVWGLSIPNKVKNFLCMPKCYTSERKLKEEKNPVD